MTNRPLSIEIEYRDPLAALAALSDEPHCVLLDGAVAGGRYSYVAASPTRTVRTDAVNGWQELAALLAEQRLETDPALPPFQTGVIACFGYELGRHLERLPQPRMAGDALPELFAGRYDLMAAFDNENRHAWVVASPNAEAGTPEWKLRDMAARLADAPLPDTPSTREQSPSLWHPETTRADYEDRARRIIEYIRAGDIFQANLTQRFLTPRPEGMTALELYHRLRAESPAAFSAFLDCGDGQAVLSASPERFLSLSTDRTVTTEPIKGSRPRGVTAEEDDAFAAALSASTKDRAENLMIVDLLRNDLSRVCETGSVKVPSLHRLERFASMHHLVSTVTGRLQPAHTALDLLRACFPGGSVTGAPKIRAMEVINEMEPARRGPYCGALGWIGANGAMETSILIRTLVVDGDTVIAQAGGGIVADSDPAAEYEESLAKARPLLRSLDPENGSGL